MYRNHESNIEFFSFLGQLYSSDQKGSQVVLSFFTDQSLTKFSVKTISIDLNSGFLTEIPVFEKFQVDLSLPVSEIQLYLTAISDYKIDIEGKLHHQR